MVTVFLVLSSYTLNRILAKKLGLSLEEIKQLLVEGLAAEQLRGLLRLKRLETLQEARKRLKRIELRGHLAMESDINCEVILKTLLSRLVASQRLTVPSNDEVPVRPRV